MLKRSAEIALEQDADEHKLRQEYTRRAWEAHDNWADDPSSLFEDELSPIPEGDEDGEASSEDEETPSSDESIEEKEPEELLDNEECDLPVYRIMILDWDDTLFPTHAITTGHDFEETSTPRTSPLLAPLILEVFEIISLYADEMHIVTNARIGWFSLTLRSLLAKPYLLTHAESEEIHSKIDELRSYFIAPAGRSRFTDDAFHPVPIHYPVEDLHRKYLTLPYGLIDQAKPKKFREILANIIHSHMDEGLDYRYKLIAIGDGNSEMTAAAQFRDANFSQGSEWQDHLSELDVIPPISVIRVKLKEKPSEELLLEQLETIRARLESLLFTHNEDIDFEV